VVFKTVRKNIFFIGMSNFFPAEGQIQLPLIFQQSVIFTEKTEFGFLKSHFSLHLPTVLLKSGKRIKFLLLSKVILNTDNLP
jgi:hypothetical protein